MLFPPTPQTDPRLENLIPAPIRPTTTSTLFNIISRTRRRYANQTPLPHHQARTLLAFPTFSPRRIIRSAITRRRWACTCGAHTTPLSTHVPLSRARTARHGTAGTRAVLWLPPRARKGARARTTVRDRKNVSRASALFFGRSRTPAEIQEFPGLQSRDIASARREGGGKPLSSPFLSLGVRRRAGGRRVEDWKRTTWPRGCGGVPRPQACWEHRPAGRPRFLFFFAFWPFFRKTT